VDITSTSDTFQLLAPFTLGSNSDGIYPTSEDVSFSLGPYAITIPAGSFTVNSKGYYHFTGTVDGVGSQAIIGSEREFGKLCILRGFLKNEEFGLGCG
jgi:hypothetical protein